MFLLLLCSEPWFVIKEAAVSYAPLSHGVSTMYLVISVLIFACLVFDTHALTCRSNGGPKESELKEIYTKCLKRQDVKNSSNSGDNWKDNHRNQRNDFEGQMGNNRGRSKDKMGNRNDADDRMGSQNDRMGNHDDRMGNHDDRTGNHDDRTGNHDDRMGSFDDRSDSYDRMGRRDSQMGSDGRSGSGGREDSMGNNRYGREDNLNGRNDFQHDFGKQFSDQYGYQSTQSPRRYKRERKEENSGKRSQFNPNPKRYQDSNSSDERNSSENNSSKDDDKKACALHCFLENLEMTAEDGMPDRYLVTHALTKEVNNEDLKDFLQESIEECFQILDNENTEDKCAFSKNLLMCMSEKGRENCDDWKDDLQF